MTKDWNKDYLKKGLNAQRLYPNEALVQYFGNQGLLSGGKHVRVLEVGCGSGANLWMMAKEGHDVCGIDYSDEALLLANKHLTKKWGGVMQL